LNHRRSSAKTKSVPTKRAVDGGDSAAFSSIFLASGFFCSQAFSQPAPPPLTPAVGLCARKESEKAHLNKMDL